MATNQVTRNIALTPHLDQFVQSKVDSGRYQSASEVVRDGLRLLEEREVTMSAALSRARREVELGWQESEVNAVVRGPGVFEEIRHMSRAKRPESKGRR